MRPVSDRFLEAIHGSHAVSCEAKIVSGHQTGTDPSGTIIPIRGGDVIHDGNADIRATLDLTTVIDIASETPLAFPRRGTDPLAPYGNEIFVRRGIQFGDRSTEWVSQGYFRIETVNQEEAPSGEIHISGLDRMAGIIDAKMLAPREFSNVSTMANVFDNLVREVYPDAVIEFPDVDADTITMGRRVVCEEDRYTFLQDLAQANSMDFYVDYRGVFVIKHRPDMHTPVVAEAAGENGVLISTSREVTRKGVYNGVVATGEGADTVTPVRGVALDYNPQSPTFWGGPFGKVPRFYSSPFITTKQQARNAARKVLMENLGLPYSLDLSAVPNPALEPYDPVRVETADHNYIHTLQKVVVPVIPRDPVTATTKDVTVVQIESS